MNKVRDYPFGYKHWCAPDGDYVNCPEQFCGEGLTLDEDGSPYQPGGRWVNKIGRTVWFQPGQMDYRLHAVSLEVTEKLVVRSISHSVFGEPKG